MKITLDINKHEAELICSREITDEQWVEICKQMPYTLEWFLQEELRDVLDEMAK